MAFSMKVPNFEKICEKYNAAGDGVLQVAVNTANRTADWALAEMKAKLEPHKRTGAALEACIKSNLEVGVSTVSVTVGVQDTKGNRQAFLHGVWQEYGSPTFQKDPWFRPVQDRMRSQINRIAKEEMEAAGFGFGGKKE